MSGSDFAWLVLVVFLMGALFGVIFEQVMSRKGNR